VIAYVDSSVVLRIALEQAGSLPEWNKIDQAVSSFLTRVESLRTLDRLRIRARLGDTELSRRRAHMLELVDSFRLVNVDSLILDRATQPLPTELGTLDAIHLVTALRWREERDQDLVMATHDVALATAARALGFRIVGVV
jgi:predicted nucleic acid-binding protein